MANNIHLNPKFELLNSNFDGYKLKSDPDQTIYTRQVDSGIFQNVTSDGTCYLFTRMESLHNHLFSDPFEPHSVYVFNKKGHLLLFSFTDGYVGSPTVVWQEDLSGIKAKELPESSFVFSPSVSFPSCSFALTSNGCGLLNILQTGDRNGASSWINLIESKVPTGSLISSLLIDTPEDQKYKQEIHALLLSVVTPEELKNDPLHSNLSEQILNTKVSALHIIYWFIFGFDGSKWELTRERRVCGFKSLEYVSLEPSGQGIVLLSHDNYYFIYDSMHPIQGKEEIKEKFEKDISKYIFMQNNDEIKLWVNVGPDILKTDVCIDVTVREIKMKVKDKVIFEKKFLNRTDSFASTWKIDEGKIEICIPKAEENLEWSTLFEGGDAEGEEIVDASVVAEVHQRLAHLTSDRWNPDPEVDKPAFNPGQLEACDDASEDLLLLVLDGHSHLISHMAHLGAVQHLFNVQLEKSVTSSFCLRHDVDGVLWQVKEQSEFDHVATFHAFGYVKASKAMAKFTQGAPDNSYVAVADVNSHVYVFFQPESLGSELRNRKSGKVCTTIARQLIISLRNHDQVMGFHSAQNCIFVLTNSDLFVYSLKTS